MLFLLLSFIMTLLGAVLAYGHFSQQTLFSTPLKRGVAWLGMLCLFLGWFFLMLVKSALTAFFMCLTALMLLWSCVPLSAALYHKHRGHRRGPSL